MVAVGASSKTLVINDAQSLKANGGTDNAVLTVADLSKTVAEDVLGAAAELQIGLVALTLRTAAKDDGTAVVSSLVDITFSAEGAINVKAEDKFDGSALVDPATDAPVDGMAYYMPAGNILVENDSINDTYTFTLNGVTTEVGPKESKMISVAGDGEMVIDIVAVEVAE